MQLEIIKNGYLECDKGFITLGKDMGKKINIPVFCFLIKHPKGNVLIDTGIAKDYSETWGKRLDFFKPTIEKDIVSYLRDIKIDYVVNTHLHVDHCGNNSSFKDAVFVIQKDEYKAASNPKPYQKMSYPDKLNKDLNFRFIDGDLDLFSDDAIKIIKTPGHSQGHQSVLLKLQDKNILIAGDACYTKENLKHNILPGILWNPDNVIESYNLIRDVSIDNKAEIIFGHEESLPEQVQPS